MRARAIENQAYVIAPAQFGPNVYGYSDYGNSMIVDPWGRVLARAADRKASWSRRSISNTRNGCAANCRP